MCNTNWMIENDSEVNDHNNGTSSNWEETVVGNPKALLTPVCFQCIYSHELKVKGC